MKYSFNVVVYRRIDSKIALNNGSFIVFFSTEPTTIASIANDVLQSLSLLYAGEGYKVEGVTTIENVTQLETSVFHFPQSVNHDRDDY